MAGFGGTADTDRTMRPPVSDPAKTTAPQPATAGFRSTRDHVRGRPLPIRVLGTFSSLRSAATLISVVAVVIGIGTYYERAFGPEAARVMVYQAWWFDLLWMLLALNIFGAAAVRYPWTRRQLGFVVVHTGLLLLIFGFYRSRGRLDGMLLAPTGEAVSAIRGDRDHLTIIDGDRRQAVSFQALQTAGLPSFARYCLDPVWSSDRPLIHTFATPLRLLSDSAWDQWVHLAVPAAAGFPRISLRSICLAADEEPGWIVGVDPAAALAVRVELRISSPAAPTPTVQTHWFRTGGETSTRIGPLEIMMAQFRTAKAVEDSALPPAEGAGRALVIYRDSESWRVPVPESLPQRVEVGNGLAVVFEQVFEHLGVEEGRPVENPELPVEPALVATLIAGEVEEPVMIFARMPGDPRFQPREIAVDVRYEHPSLREGKGELGAVLALVQGPGEVFQPVLISRSKGLDPSRWTQAGDSWSGLVMGGEGLPMRMEATIKPIVHATRGPRPIQVRPDRLATASRWIEFLVERGAATGSAWVRRDDADQPVVAVPMSDGTPVLLKYATEVYDLAERHGFQVRLDRFDLGTDLGGGMNASYASEVTVLPANGTPWPARISMNNTLTVNGVTLYQSSFEPRRDESGRPIPGQYAYSGFSAATDPGRFWKYLGSIVLVTGIILLFLLNRRLPVARRSAAPASNP